MTNHVTDEFIKTQPGWRTIWLICYSLHLLQLWTFIKIVLDCKPVREAQVPFLKGIPVAPLW